MQNGDDEYKDCSDSGELPVETDPRRKPQKSKTRGKRNHERRSPSKGQSKPSKKNAKKVDTKVDPKVDTARRAKTEAEIAKKIGKQTAKEFVHENLVFPTRLDIVIDPYELSMSSLAKKGIHHTSYLYEEKHFNAFFVAHLAHWFKCCNEVRSEIMWSSKERYFSK